MIASLLAFNIKSVLVQIYKDMHYIENIDTNIFLEKEITQIFMTEQIKYALKPITPLRDELPLSSFIDMLENLNPIEK